MSRRGLFVVLAAGALLGACGLVCHRPPGARFVEEISAGQMTAGLAALADRITAGELTAAMKIVDPQAQLAGRYRRSADAITVLDDGVEVRVALARAPVPRSSARRRIVLDPGHFGGGWAGRENRMVTADGQVAREGDLSYSTALLAQAGLVGRGYQVWLTRGASPSGDFPAGADPAFVLERELDLTPPDGRPRPGEEAPFSLYRQFDHRRRAALAEQLGPDALISIHYNAISAGGNGVMAFVPGNCLPGELATRSQRFHAWRTILGGALPQSIALATRAARAMQRGLQLPPASAEPWVGEGYLLIDAGAGVYARNLAVLRRTPGVAVLLEGPSVTSPGEAALLLAPDQARQRAYATAVVSAVIDSGIGE